MALQDETNDDLAMRQVQFVMLKSPSEMPSTELSEQERTDLQEGHLEFLQGLWEKRIALAVGPIEDGGDLRGIAVLDFDNADEAKAILANDPLVKAGYLEMEVHGWLCSANLLQKGTDFRDLAPVQLGLLYRRADAVELPQERIAELQAGHMANINRMADAGVLSLAGPIIGTTPFRGIFMFESIDAEKAKEWVADDPTIKEGRLEMRLFTWYTPKGSFKKF